MLQVWLLSAGCLLPLILGAAALRRPGGNGLSRLALALSAVAGLAFVDLGFRTCFDEAALTYGSKEWYVPLALSRGKLIYQEIGYLYGPLPPFLTLAAGKLRGAVDWRAFQWASLALGALLCLEFWALARRLFPASRALADLLTVGTILLVTLSGQIVHAQALVYPIEGCCYLGALLLASAQRGRLRFLIQGALLGIAWLSKPFAPCALLLGLALAEARTFRPALWPRLIERSVLRVLALCCVVAAAALALRASGVGSSYVIDGLFPFFVQKMYVQEGMSSLKQFREAYFGPHSLPYFILRSDFYLLLAGGVLGSGWLALRRRRLPPIAYRASLAAGAFWISSLLVIWGQWDNHAYFDFMLAIAMGTALQSWLAVAPAARRRRVAVAVLVVLALGMMMRFRLSIGGQAMAPSACVRVVGVPVTPEAAGFLLELADTVRSLDPEGRGALVDVSNLPALNELLGRPKLWRYSNFISGMDRDGDLGQLMRQTSGRDLIFVDDGAIEGLFDVESFDPALAEQVQGEERRALFRNWTDGIRLVRELRFRDRVYRVYVRRRPA